MSKIRTIGIILDDESKQGLKHSYFSEILETFKLLVEKQDISLVYLNNDRTRENSKTYLEQLKDFGCVACVIACIADSEETEAVLESDIPVVAIDKNYANAICVCSDNENGMRILTEYVIEKGHKKIAFIMGDDNEITNKRINGFLCACEKHHIKVPAEYLIRGKYISMDKAHYHTENLLKMEEAPTCIMYSDDYASIGGINLINSRGVIIAKDIAITGYDGNAIISQFEPKLTTIKQDCVKMGEIAAEKIIEVINNPSVNNNGTYVADVILVEGRTVHRVYE